ncbi:hypothetical protein I4U23_004103 [Adineta vaga]|nr:hypothetical protein I4U23_004103 [Adineta vaga]
MKVILRLFQAREQDDGTVNLSEKGKTSLENLSNELIYEIFEYLHLHHAFQAFYNLNERFDNLFKHFKYPIKIDISSISTSTYERYAQHVIRPHAKRIKSLRISNPFVNEIYLQLLPAILNFIRLEALTLTNIDVAYLPKILDQLYSLSTLSSLTIISDDYLHKSINVYEKIFRLPRLRYCQMLLKTSENTFFDITNELNTIEYLVVNQTVSFDQLDSLLSYVPKLQRLSIIDLYELSDSRRKSKSLSLDLLTNVSITVKNIEFNDFQSIARDYFRQVQVLHLKVQCKAWYNDGIQYLDANRWEQLISTYIPNLSIFDFQYIHYFRGEIDRENYDTCIRNFNSIFFVKHEWLFDYQYHPQSDTAVFFSRNPYRRKDYLLHGDWTKNIWASMTEINQDPMHHIYLHNSTTTEQYADIISNVNEMSFVENLDISYHSFDANSQLIFPGKQLTKVNIYFRDFSVEDLIELIELSPKVHTLKLACLVSKTNNMKKLTIEDTIRAEQFKLIVDLFPQLENLSIDLYRHDLESIAHYLWAKFDNISRRLCLLCIAHERERLDGILKDLIESNKLRSHYYVKLTSDELIQLMKRTPNIQYLSVHLSYQFPFRAQLSAISKLNKLCITYFWNSAQFLRILEALPELSYLKLNLGDDCIDGNQ